jgi:hypothetical protein
MAIHEHGALFVVISVITGLLIAANFLRFYLKTQCFENASVDLALLVLVESAIILVLGVFLSMVFGGLN